VNNHNRNRSLWMSLVRNLKRRKMKLLYWVPQNVLKQIATMLGEFLASMVTNMMTVMMSPNQKRSTPGTKSRERTVKTVKTMMNVYKSSKSNTSEILISTGALVLR